MSEPTFPQARRKFATMGDAVPTRIRMLSLQIMLARPRVRYRRRNYHPAGVRVADELRDGGRKLGFIELTLCADRAACRTASHD